MSSCVTHCVNVTYVTQAKTLDISSESYICHGDFRAKNFFSTQLIFWETNPRPEIFRSKFSGVNLKIYIFFHSASSDVETRLLFYDNWLSLFFTTTKNMAIFTAIKTTNMATLVLSRSQRLVALGIKRMKERQKGKTRLATYNISRTYN